MTDSKTVVEDLAAWLTAVWDEEERLAKKAGGDRWIIDGSIVHESRPHEDVVDWVYDEADEHIAYHDPAQMLARIAADRKILALHHKAGFTVFTMNGEAEQRERYCEVCQRGDEEELVYPCETLLLLASPYADREGFRSEWLVERQGVEG